ncbi:hypothetical protein CN507_07555 [Bacillus cereus]|nr:hypothetical protein CN507_07555 [Bacillus cereus]
MKKGLNPTVPVDPLASLDIFGQQRFSIQEPHLTKTFTILYYSINIAHIKNDINISILYKL